MALAIALEHAQEAQAFKSTTGGGYNRRLFWELNAPVSSRQPFTVDGITWTPVN